MEKDVVPDGNGAVGGTVDPRPSQGRWRDGFRIPRHRQSPCRRPGGAQPLIGSTNEKFMMFFGNGSKKLICIMRLKGIISAF